MLVLKKFISIIRKTLRQIDNSSMASWSRFLVTFRSLQPCLSLRSDLFLWRMCTCRKNGRSKCVAFHRRITFSWLLVFRPDSHSGTRARAYGKFFQTPLDRESTWPTSELCKTISATVSTWLTDGRFNFHTRITDNFVDA